MAKILLVEDDKSLREIYGVRLEAEGYQIVSAGDGEEALAMAIKEKPDLIVSDVMMPKISGFDMLDILRSTTETRDVKVIMMTALSSDDQRARGESLGADRYLVKSQVGIEDVVRTVHDVLADAPANTDAANVPAFAPTPPTQTPTPAPTPVAAAPTPAPVAPAVPATPQPVSAPVQNFSPVTPTPAQAPAVAPAPVQPPVDPVYSVPAAPEPTPVATAPAAAPVTTPVPAPAPAPVQAPTFPPAPVTSVPPVAPVPTPQPPSAPQPFSSPLPEPTAPFSSPRPASLGDRVINPISAPESLQVPTDMSTLINQELGGTTPPSQTPPAVPPSSAI